MPLRCCDSVFTGCWLGCYKNRNLQDLVHVSIKVAQRALAEKFPGDQMEQPTIADAASPKSAASPASGGDSTATGESSKSGLAKGKPSAKTFFTEIEKELLLIRSMREYKLRIQICGKKFVFAYVLVLNTTLCACIVVGALLWSRWAWLFSLKTRNWCMLYFALDFHQLVIALLVFMVFHRAIDDICGRRNSIHAQFVDDLCHFVSYS